MRSASSPPDDVDLHDSVKPSATSHRRNLQVAAALSLLASFLTGKVIALTLGPGGVGFQGAVVSTGSLTALLATWAVANNLPALAAARPTSSRNDFTRVLVRASALAFLPSMALASALALPELLANYSMPVVATGLLLGSLASVLLTAQPTALSTFHSSGSAARYQLVGSVTSAASTIAAVLLLDASLLPSIVGGGLLLGQIVASAATLRRGRSSSPSHPVPLMWFVRGSLPVYGSTVISGMAIGLSPLIVLTIAGPDTSGLLRAATALGSIPTTILMSSVALHFYPAVSRACARREPTRGLTRESIRSVVGRAAISSLLLAILAPWLLWIAFSKSFVGAAGALSLLAGAGVIRILTLHNAFLLLAQQRKRAYLVSEAVVSVVLIVGVICAATLGNLLAVAATVWVTYLLHLAITGKCLKEAPDPGANVQSAGLPTVAIVLAIPVIAIIWNSQYAAILGP